jgi:hypothetical protein
MRVDFTIEQVDALAQGLRLGDFEPRAVYLEFDDRDGDLTDTDVPEDWPGALQDALFEDASDKPETRLPGVHAERITATLLAVDEALYALDATDLRDRVRHALRDLGEDIPPVRVEDFMERLLRLRVWFAGLDRVALVDNGEEPAVYYANGAEGDEGEVVGYYSLSDPDRLTAEAMDRDWTKHQAKKEG